MRKLIGGVTVALVLAATAARADEEKVDVDKLPKAVLDAVKAKFPKAELVGASKEKEGDKTLYEVRIKDGKTKADVSLTEEGKIVSIEKEIAAADLPKEVTDALEARYAKAKIDLAEEVTDKDDKVVYELHVTTADGKKGEVVFDPKGKFVKEEFKKEEK
jgi:hypothetical protein